MCYSAQIEADYDKFVRVFGAVISLKRFVELFWEKRKDGGWNKIPKAMREPFRKPRGEEGFELARIVAEGDREWVEKLQAELTQQTERLLNAEAILAGPKPTKKAAEDQRIATAKIKAARRNLEDLEAQGTAREGLPYLPRQLCPGDGRARRPAHRCSHALPVSTAGLERCD